MNGMRFRQGKIPLFPTAPRVALGSTSPLIPWLPRMNLLEIKWPVHQVDFSQPSNKELYNVCSNAFLLPYVFIARVAS